MQRQHLPRVFRINRNTATSWAAAAVRVILLFLLYKYNISVYLYNMRLLQQRAASWPFPFLFKYYSTCRKREYSICTHVRRIHTYLYAKDWFPWNRFVVDPAEGGHATARHFRPFPRPRPKTTYCRHWPREICSRWLGHMHHHSVYNRRVRWERHPTVLQVLNINEFAENSKVKLPDRRPTIRGTYV